MIRKIPIIFILFFCFSGFARGQSNSVTGTVIDSFNNRFLGNAVVMAINPSDSSLIQFTRTKADGTFELKSIKRDSIKIQITYPGYADFSESMLIKGNKRDMGMINFMQLSQLIEFERRVVK